MVGGFGFPIGNIGPSTGADFTPLMQELERQQQAQQFAQQLQLQKQKMAAEEKDSFLNRAFKQAELEGQRKLEMRLAEQQNSLQRELANQKLLEEIRQFDVGAGLQERGMSASEQARRAQEALSQQELGLSAQRLGVDQSREARLLDEMNYQRQQDASALQRSEAERAATRSREDRIRQAETAAVSTAAEILGGRSASAPRVVEFIRADAEKFFPGDKESQAVFMREAMAAVSQFVQDPQAMLEEAFAQTDAARELQAQMSYLQAIASSSNDDAERRAAIEGLRQASLDLGMERNRFMASNARRYGVANLP